MIDENVWFGLSDSQKQEELENWLTEYRAFSAGTHELYKDRDFEKIKLLKLELKSKIYKVIALEHIK